MSKIQIHYCSFWCDKTSTSFSDWKFSILELIISYCAAHIKMSKRELCLIVFHIIKAWKYLCHLSDYNISSVAVNLFRVSHRNTLSVVTAVVTWNLKTRIRTAKCLYRKRTWKSASNPPEWRLVLPSFLPSIPGVFSILIWSSHIKTNRINYVKETLEVYYSGNTEIA